MKERFMKNGVFSLEYDKETLKDMVLTLQEENQELKKQLEEKENIACNWKDSCLENAGKIEILENQQKEFIKWLENGIEKVKNTEFLDEKIQRAGLIAYNRCLQKYKSIIGVSDEKK